MKNILLPLSILIISTNAHSFDLDSLFSTKLLYAEIEDYNFCYEDMENEDSYYVSSGSIDQIAAQYIETYGENFFEVNGMSLKSFNDSDGTIENITFHDDSDKITFHIGLQELSGGKCIEITKIAKNTNVYKPEEGYEDFEKLADYIIGYNDNPESYALGQIYNHHAVLKGFHLGMSKEKGCELLKTLRGNDEIEKEEEEKEEEVKDEYLGLLLGTSGNDRKVEYQEKIEDGFEYCGYNDKMKIVLLHDVLNPSFLKFKNNKLVYLYLGPKLVQKIFNAENVSADVLAQAFTDNIPWLSNGLVEEDHGWSAELTDHWDFFLFGSKSLILSSKQSNDLSF